MDDVDISKIGLTDLRSRLTIIPRMLNFRVNLTSMAKFDAEDPTILSGTVRSTLDVFDEYQDAEIVSLSKLILFRGCNK